MDVNMNSKVYEGAKVIEVGAFDQKQSGTKVIAHYNPFFIYLLLLNFSSSAPTSPADVSM